MSELVHYETRGAVAVITLDSQPNRNALSPALMERLAGRITDALADDRVRVVTLTHEGRVFCSGMDLSASQGRAADDMPVNAFPDILRALWESGKPTLARVAGPARAGGIGLLAACDLVVAARTATFAFTEVRLGLAPAVISPVVLRRMDRRAAHELFLTGEVFDGDRAARVGLVDSAVEPERLDEETNRYVDMLLRGGPGALAACKRLTRRPAGPSMAADLAELGAVSAERFASEEGQEGIAAFAAKRQPRWAPQ